MQIETHRAIPNVCAWPNLTLLPDGTILAAIWNQPCHGTWEGDLDCWGSEDGGQSWNFRARIAPHEPTTNRMNCAAGLAKNGDVLVLVAGWSNRNPPPHGTWVDNAQNLRPWICRSRDGGQSWQVTGELPPPEVAGATTEYVPFSDVQQSADGALCVAAYVQCAVAGETQSPQTPRKAFLLRSYDDGQSWGEPALIDGDASETAILHLGNGEWLAAARSVDLHFLRSRDDGKSWQEYSRLEEPCAPHQMTGHLSLLRDGRVLYTCGNRSESNCIIEARLSDDDGQSWSPPVALAETTHWDSGYPSSVQRADGKIVTAYYVRGEKRAGKIDYAMDVAIWDVAGI